MTLSERQRPPQIRAPRRIVVIGASAGGVPALTKLMPMLAPELDASILVVLHLPPNARSVLPEILTRAGPLVAAHPRDYEPMISGLVYVAPPDRHLLVNGHAIRVTVGPWENGHRPSVDVLFRSAAQWHGARVIAVVLSGALDDGAAGVAAVAQQGGVVFVQDPNTAEVPDMPRRALETVPDAIVLPVDAIAEEINRLTRTGPPAAPLRKVDPSFDSEIRTAEGAREDPDHLDAAPAALGCPDCGGGLYEIADGRVLRYRCRVGHAYSADSLVNAHARKLEEALWTAVRVLEDDVVVHERLLSRAEGHGRHHSAKRFAALRDERMRLIEAMRDAIADVVENEPTLTKRKSEGDAT